MTTLLNRQVLLESRPDGIPQAEHFRIVATPVPALEAGQVLIRNIYLSVEPAMRGWVSAARNYSEPVAIGAVMRRSPPAVSKLRTIRRSRWALSSPGCSACRTTPW